MGAESYQDVRPDPMLTPIAQEYGTGGGFAYQSVVPVRPVGARNYKFGTWDFSTPLSNDVDARRMIGDSANEAKSPLMTYTEGTTQENSLKDKLADEIRNGSPNPAAIERHKIANITNKLNLGIESELKTALDAAANATTLTGTAQWNNASAAIEKSIDDGMESFVAQCGFEANVIVIPVACWHIFKRDSTVRDAIKYTNPDILNGRGGIPKSVFGLEIVVPGALINTANPGATASIARVWATDKAYLMYVDMSAANDPEAITAAFLARYPGDAGVDWATRTWRDPDPTTKTSWYSVEEHHDLQINAACVHRLDDVLA
jgi:hypothetical protein